MEKICGTACSFSIAVLLGRNRQTNFTVFNFFHLGQRRLYLRSLPVVLMSLQGMLSQRLELIGAIALKGFGAAEGINVNEALNQ